MEVVLNKTKKGGSKKMENKLTKMVAVLAVLGLMAAAPAAYAESAGTGDTSGGKAGWRHEHGEGKEFFKGLNLTLEQKAKLDAQREAKRKSNQALRDQLKTKMQALHEAIAKPGATQASVSGLVNEISALKGQMFAQRIDGIFAMKGVLTPEQFAKMQEHRKEKMKGKGEGWGKHHQESKEDPSEPE
jgi:Spy/CpxP family protein refolding chaperone